MEPLDKFTEMISSDAELIQLDLDMEDIVDSTAKHGKVTRAELAEKVVDAMFELDMLLTLFDLELAKKYFIATNDLLVELSNAIPPNHKD